MKKKRFGLKLYFYNLIMVALLVGGFFAVFIWYYIDNQNTEVSRSLDEAIRTSEENLEEAISDLDEIALQLSTNPNLVSVMKEIPESKEENYFQTHLIEAATVYELLWSYILDLEDVSGVSIYNKQGDFIFAGATEEQALLERDEAFMEELDVQFRKPRTNRIFINELQEDGERRSVSVVREINDTFLVDNIGIGYVEVYLEGSSLEEKIDVSDENSIIVLYESTEENVIGTNLKDYVENTKWKYQDLIQDLELEAAYQKQGELENLGIGVVALQDSTEQTRFIMNIILLGLVLSFWLILSMAWIQKKVVDSLTQPLMNLCQNVQYGEEEQEDQRELVQSDIYEIEVLSTAFDDMVSRLEKSMQKEISSRTSQIKTQLYALQAQMNPHFIHNTIAIIQSYAIEEDYDTIMNICGSLSDLIRYNTKMMNNKIAMREEIEHIENYMSLVKLRYEDHVQYSVVMPEELKQVQMPCFMLQPLVENSLNHGLKNKPFPWGISIRCAQHKDGWTIEIKDNGCGMAVEEIEQVSAFKSNLITSDRSTLLEDNEWRIGGLTMKNVMTRLYLEYEDAMIFEIESREGEYTLIRIGGSLS